MNCEQILTEVNDRVSEGLGLGRTTKEYAKNIQSISESSHGLLSDLHVSKIPSIITSMNMLTRGPLNSQNQSYLQDNARGAFENSSSNKAELVSINSHLEGLIAAANTEIEYVLACLNASRSASGSSSSASSRAYAAYSVSTQILNKLNSTPPVNLSSINDKLDRILKFLGNPA